MCIYIALTDGRGTVPIKLRLTDVDEDKEPLFETEAEVEFPDPRTVLEMEVVMRGVVFPEAGEYRLQILGRHGHLLERRIVVQQVEG